MKVLDILFNAGVIAREKLTKRRAGLTEYNQEYGQEMAVTKATSKIVAIVVLLAAVGALATAWFTSAH